jgi:hypothetical protein
VVCAGTPAAASPVRKKEGPKEFWQKELEVAKNLNGGLHYTYPVCHMMKELIHAHTRGLGPDKNLVLSYDRFVYPPPLPGKGPPPKQPQQQEQPGKGPPPPPPPPPKPLASRGKGSPQPPPGPRRRLRRRRAGGGGSSERMVVDANATSPSPERQRRFAPLAHASRNSSRLLGSGHHRHPRSSSRDDRGRRRRSLRHAPGPDESRERAARPSVRGKRIILCYSGELRGFGSGEVAGNHLHKLVRPLTEEPLRFGSLAVAFSLTNGEVWCIQACLTRLVPQTLHPCDFTRYY